MSTCAAEQRDRDAAAARIEDRGEERDRDEAHRVLEHRPHDERASRPLVERALATPAHVHDHDRARERGREPDRQRTGQRQSGRERDAGADRDAEDDLQGRSDQEAGRLVPAERAYVELDADLEQQEDDADVREDLELVPFDEISRRERSDGQADDQISDDGR